MFLLTCKQREVSNARGHLKRSRLPLVLEVVRRSFGLDPSTPQGPEFTADRAMGNTFDAHRLVHLGRSRGVAGQVTHRL